MTPTVWRQTLLMQAAVSGLLLALVIGPRSAQGQTSAERPMLLETEASEKLLREGRKQLFDFRMAAAEHTFARLAKRPDGKIAAHHQWALIALLKGMVTDDREHFDAFLERSGAVAELLDEAPESRWRDYLKAEVYLQRCLARAKTGSHMKAAWAARKAFNHFDALTGETSTFYEPKLGMGLLHVAVGSMPGSYRRLLSFLGFDGTVTGGVRELKQAARLSEYHRFSARIVLALIDITIHQDPGRGRGRLAELYQERPKSLLVAQLYGFALLADRRAKKAESVLRRAAARATDDDYFYIHYVDYYLAEAFFKQNAFAKAERYYRRYLGRHDGPALQALAYLRLGEAVEMQGRRAEAKRYYQQTETGRDFDSDRAALRAAREHLEAPIAPRERVLLKGRNAYDAGHYAEAESLLKRIFESPEATPDQRAEAAYRRGRVFHAQGQLTRAARAYRYAVEHPGDEKAKWGPWSQFYLGEIHAARGSEKRAAQAYDKALSYGGDFDYAQSLEQAVRAARDRADL